MKKQMHDMEFEHSIQYHEDTATDTEVLEIALRRMSLALNELVMECLNIDGSAKAPSRQAIMRACGLLPPYCSQTLSKRKER